MFANSGRIFYIVSEFVFCCFANSTRLLLRLIFFHSAVFVIMRATFPHCWFYSICICNFKRIFFWCYLILSSTINLLLRSPRFIIFTQFCFVILSFYLIFIYYLCVVLFYYFMNSTHLLQLIFFYVVLDLYFYYFIISPRFYVLLFQKLIFLSFCSICILIFAPFVFVTSKEYFTRSQILYFIILLFQNLILFQFAIFVATRAIFIQFHSICICNSKRMFYTVLDFIFYHPTNSTYLLSQWIFFHFTVFVATRTTFIQFVFVTPKERFTQS